MKTMSNADYEQVKRLLADLCSYVQRDNLRKSEAVRKASCLLRKFERIEERKRNEKDVQDKFTSIV